MKRGPDCVGGDHLKVSLMIDPKIAKLGALPVTPEQIEAIASRAAHQAAREATKEVLLQLGISTESPLEMQHDMQYLRTWRQSMDKLTTKGMLIVATFVITGLLALLVSGLKTMLMGWVR